MDEWNKNLETLIARVQEANHSLRSQLESGEITEQRLLGEWEPMPRMIPRPGINWARWFLKTWGWSSLSRGSDNQQALTYNHPDMEIVRCRVKALFQTHQIHNALALNFDQLWRCCWQWSARMLFKDRANKGRRCGKKKAPKTQDKKLNAIKGGRAGITVPRPLVMSYSLSDTNKDHEGSGFGRYKKNDTVGRVCFNRQVVFPWVLL